MKYKKSNEVAKKILEADIYPAAFVTPITKAQNVSDNLKNNVFLKREDLQPIFSFKLRGAYNKLSKISLRSSGPVIAASAGNHAQGVAFAAKQKGLKSIIVMPNTTPEIKKEAVYKLGARVILHGDNFDEAFKYAKDLSNKRDYLFVHPYDDMDVICGQGTIGKEILDVFSDEIDYVFVPVGGGGLIAGVGSYIKTFNPKTKIIAVEPDDADCLNMALKSNKRVSLKEVGLFADGVAVKQIGNLTYAIIKEWIDDVVTVSVDEMCAAIEDTFKETRTLPEPAGSLALAGLKKYAFSKKLRNKNLIAINSGANLNFDRLGHIVERVQIGEGKEALLSVKIQEERGSFRKFCKVLGKRMISEFNYRADESKEANIFFACRFQNRSDIKTLKKHLKSKGYSSKDLSNNELAKLHIKHMVGGRAPTYISSKGENLFRVQFPEKPGALISFLDTLGDKWNITLFHYRNQGAAYGRVLVGFEADSTRYKDLIKHLKSTGYRFWEETSNPAYKAFLE